jgi:hypothetical protein
VAKKKIFISFNFKNVGQRNDMVRLFAASGGKLEATPVYVVNDVSAGKESAIRAEIQRVLAPCSGLIALISDDAHNSPWIDYELGYAHSQRIPTVAVRHPQSRGGIPNSHKGMRVMDWNSQELVDLVRGWPTR